MYVFYITRITIPKKTKACCSTTSMNGADARQSIDRRHLSPAARLRALCSPVSANTNSPAPRAGGELNASEGFELAPKTGVRIERGGVRLPLRHRPTFKVFVEKLYRSPPSIGLVPNISRVVAGAVTVLLSDFAVLSVNGVLRTILHRECAPRFDSSLLGSVRPAYLRSTNPVHPAITKWNGVNISLTSGHRRLPKGTVSDRACGPQSAYRLLAIGSSENRWPLNIQGNSLWVHS